MIKLNKEFINYITNYISFYNFFGNIIFLISFMIRSILRKSRYIHYFYYPKKIKVILKRINLKINKNIDYPNTKNPNLEINKLKLATDYLKFYDSPNWNSKFDDNEQLISLHRWNWLLSELTDDNSKANYEWGVFMIRSYLRSMGPLPKGIISESYTMGEKISNSYLFSKETTNIWNSFPLDINESLKNIANKLVKKIEFYDNDLTSNHAVNNARALIIIGHSQSSNEFLEIGREILYFMLPKLIDHKGFLREGSSHYQFIFTRWLLEIRMISEDYNDTKTIKIIKKYLFDMVDACKFFIVKNNSERSQVPIFGDISPDCEIDWIIDLPNSSLAKFSSEDYKSNINLNGWSKLYSNWKSKKNINWSKNKINKKEVAAFKKIKFDNWILYIRNENPSLSIISSHAHYDFCSFVLFYKGKEVIIDSGRKNYNKKYSESMFPDFHSSITLDGHSASLRRSDKFFPSDYKKIDTSYELINDYDNIKLILYHDGFSRISKKKITHERTFRLYKKNCIISDCLRGHGNYLLKTYLQMPEALEYKKFDSQIKLINGINLKLESYINDKDIIKYKVLKVDKDSIRGVRSRVYGKEEPSTSLEYEENIVLPVSLSQSIKIVE